MYYARTVGSSSKHKLSFVWYCRGRLPAVIEGSGYKEVFGRSHGLEGGRHHADWLRHPRRAPGTRQEQSGTRSRAPPRDTYTYPRLLLLYTNQRYMPGRPGATTYSVGRDGRAHEAGAHEGGAHDNKAPADQTASRVGRTTMTRTITMTMIITKFPFPTARSASTHPTSRREHPGSIELS